MKKYQAIIEDTLLDVGVVEEKQYGIFRKKTKYLVSFVRTTYGEYGTISNREVKWVKHVYEKK